MTHCSLIGSTQKRGGKSARSVMIVTNGRSGYTLVQLSQICRLKWGMTEIKRSAGFKRQNSSRRRTNGLWNRRMVACSRRERCATERPAVLQKDVVLALDADAGQFAQNVQPVGEILKLNQPNLPVALLLSNDRLQSDGGVAMSSSTIMEDEVNSLHSDDCVIGLRTRKRAHFMPC